VKNKIKRRDVAIKNGVIEEGKEIGKEQLKGVKT
jgi:hypothetical protein